ncbi:uncharacterized protein N7515_000695 [Penicillium bovifimosum]|uniref:Aquaporin-like protein n=1 Tax=Penicillium bovifimosum TaxID=126998 RepID=A0A9W9HG31_9EURO|nr:uncharacterized protein N7515_000695 [Penicillium bovifimosum]KAJ5146131.1 hypothetical protein N7515_000695 [Penicillium bovifimosum]
MLSNVSLWRSGPDTDELPSPTTVVPFAGRIGANQEFSVDKTNSAHIELLQQSPDAAPWIPLKDALSLRHFLHVALWKAAAVEAIGPKFSVAPSVAKDYMITLRSIFATGALVPSLLGGLTAILVLPLFIFAAGPVSGAHLNPTITIATFFGRLATLPRCILYVGFQVFGGAIGGLLLRASLDTRSFIVPGCFIDTTKVSAGSAFAIEFTTDLALIFLSFGVGLDPRQRSVFGPALGPIFVGIVLGMCTFVTGFSRPGYTGFCKSLSQPYIAWGSNKLQAGNPARCFGAMVGSHFASYHWIHWIAPLCASIIHGMLYYLIPPYSRKRTPYVGEGN